MNKHDFDRLFSKILKQSIHLAEESLDLALSKNLNFVIHGANRSGYETTDYSEVLNLLFINEHTFYAIVDISVMGFNENQTKIFVRISNHKPRTFDKTWNDPKGNGPFKILHAPPIKQIK